MKKIFKDTVGFFRTFSSCVEKAARDTDQHYYIPKGRFQDHDPAGVELTDDTGHRNMGRFSAFFHTLRNCISTAWEESDSQYHIPKTRFRDTEENGRERQPSIVVPAQRIYDPAGSGVWSVRPEHHSANSDAVKEARTDDAVYADSIDETFNPPRLTSE